MQYMLMITNDSEIHPQPGGPGWEDLMTGYYAFHQHLTSEGIKFSGEALMPAHTATTIRIRDQKTVTSDGPFTESKEWVSGYYIVDVSDLDEALALAAMIPSAKYGSVEVRPVMQMQPAAN
jgi:hypothetical protein